MVAARHPTSGGVPAATGGLTYNVQPDEPDVGPESDGEVENLNPKP